MTDSDSDYAYADRMLAQAVAAMLAEPSVYEGLLRAERGYLCSLDVDSDLPEHLRSQFRLWREKICGGSNRAPEQCRLLKTLRSLPVEHAKRQAMALIEIASEAAASR